MTNRTCLKTARGRAAIVAFFSLLAFSTPVGAQTPSFFNGQTPSGSASTWYYLAFPDGSLFGDFYYTPGSSDAWINHLDMGSVYYEVGATPDNGSVDLYDLTSNNWFWTEPTLFPWLVVLETNSSLYGHWLVYQLDPWRPGDYTTGPPTGVARYFVDKTADQTITLDTNGDLGYTPIYAPSGVNPFSETQGKDALYRLMIIRLPIGVQGLFWRYRLKRRRALLASNPIKE